MIARICNRARVVVSYTIAIAGHFIARNVRRRISVNYSELDKTNPPHNFMRNSFVEISTEELIVNIGNHKTEIDVLTWELETMEWEFGHRSKV